VGPNRAVDQWIRDWHPPTTTCAQLVCCVTWLHPFIHGGCARTSSLRVASCAHCFDPSHTICRRCEIAIAHRSSHAPAHASRHPAVRYHSTCSTHANASPAKVDGRSLSADGGSYLESSARSLFLVTWPPACYAITALFSESPFMKS
jgi:hypothetical protein